MAVPHIKKYILMFVISIFLVASVLSPYSCADAFLVPPPAALPHLDDSSYHRCCRYYSCDGDRKSMAVSPSFLPARRSQAVMMAAASSSPLPPSSAAYESSVKAVGAEVAGDETTQEPMLRTLYDAPPPIANISDYVNGVDDATNDDDNEINDRWVTHITSGKLATESQHVLYYEVHHRFRRGDCENIDGKNKMHLTLQEEQIIVPLQDSEHARKKNEQKGKRQGGLTALFLHGGPGAACFPNHVRFFSPHLYEYVVLLDQRGCGRSTPRGRVEENTLELLVEDVERLRVHLLNKAEELDVKTEDEVRGSDALSSESLAVSVSNTLSSAIRPWDVILGGSWGCTLALAYAHAYPNHVRAMVLRGVCLFRSREIDWLFGDPEPPPSPPKSSNLRSLLSEVGMGNRKGDGGDVSSISASAMVTASAYFPGEWENFRKESNIGNKYDVDDIVSSRSISDGLKNRRTILHRYYHLLLGSDPLIRFNATKAWMRWEMGIYSSGFRGLNQVGKDYPSTDKKNDLSGNSNNKNVVLVWNPHTRSWAFEDARVWNDESFYSISHMKPPSSISKTTPLPQTPQETGKDYLEGLTKSLRRFSSYPTLVTRPSLLSSSSRTSPLEPIPIRSTASSSGIPLIKSSLKTTTNSNSVNSASDTNDTIPSQAMLTCYYSTNDDYCIGRYRSFLNLESPPPPMPLSSWYSSKLPPLMPQLSSQTESPFPQPIAASRSTTHFPLPPTIAIQGGTDAICPPDTALDLHDIWKELELRIVMNGGHSMYDPVIAGEIVKSLDRFGHELKKKME